MVKPSPPPAPESDNKKKKFRITRHNFIKVIVIVYAVIIGAILIVKFASFAMNNEDFFRRFGKAVAPHPVDYKKHLTAIRTAVSKETVDFFEQAKERLAGEKVARMSDLGKSLQGAVAAYFDEDARRLREANLTGEATESEEPRELRSAEELNTNLHMLLLGLDGLVRTYNAEQPYDTDLVYEFDADKTELVETGERRTELAKIIFPDRSSWTLSFDGSEAKDDFLGGLELLGEDATLSLALVEIKGVIQFAERRDGEVWVMSGNEVLSRWKALLDRKLPEARAKDRLARAGVTTELPGEPSGDSPPGGH